MEPRLSIAVFGRRRPATPLLPRYDHATGWHRVRPLCWLLFAVFGLLYGAVFALFGVRSLSVLALPLGLLALAVVWLLPVTDRAPVRWMHALLIAFLAALLCWPDYIALQLKGAPWITAARLTVVPLLFLMLVALSQSRAFRHDLGAVLRDVPWLWRPLVGFAVLAFVSIAFSGAIGFSAGRFVRAQTTWTLPFFVAAALLGRPDRVRAFSFVLWGSALLLCAVALWESRLGRLPWLGHIPSFLKVDPEMLEQITRPKLRSTTGAFRVQAMQTTPLGLAEALALIAPFLLHLGLTERSAAVRVLAFATLPLLFVVVRLTDARLGMVGLLLTVLLYVLAVALRRWRARRREGRDSPLAALVVAAYPAMFALFVAATFLVGRLRNITWGNGATQGSSDARAQQWAQGLPKALSHPWGHGIGRSSDVLGWSSGSAARGSIDTYYLSILLEYGVLGFLVFYGMLVAAIVYGGLELWRSRGAASWLLAPFVVALCNFLVIKSVLSQEANHPLAFVMLGAVAALVHRSKAARRAAGIAEDRKEA